MGNDGMRKILLSTNTPPLSSKSLQKTSNKVMTMIESVSDSVDMRHRCHQLVDVNTLRGSDSPHAIPVQSDGMYNNPLYSGGGRDTLPAGDTDCVLIGRKCHK